MNTRYLLKVLFGMLTLTTSGGKMLINLPTLVCSYMFFVTSIKYSNNNAY